MNYESHVNLPAIPPSLSCKDLPYHLSPDRRPVTSRHNEQGCRKADRDSKLTNMPFYITSSGHLCHPLNRKILSVALLRLRFCSIRGGKFDLNLSVKLGTSVNSKSLIDALRIAVGMGIVCTPFIRDVWRP